MPQLLSLGVLMLPLVLADQPPAAKPGVVASPPPESSLRVTVIDSSLRASLIDLISLDTSDATLRRAGGPPIPLSECLAIAPQWWLIPSEQPRNSGVRPSRPGTPPSTHLGLPPPRAVRIPITATSTPSTKPSAEQEEPEVQPPPPIIIEPGHLDLIDGQRLTGHPLIPADPASPQPSDGSLAWANPRLGALSVPLELVRRVVIRPESGSRQAQSQKYDLVVLSNGDRLSGFIESVGRQVVISPETAEGSKPGTAAIDIGQVAVIEFANAAAAARQTSMVWLSDGSVIAASKVAIDAPSGRASLAAAIRADKPDSESETSSLQLGEMAAIAFDSSRLVPLASLPATATSGGSDRRITPPATTAAVPGFDVSPLSCDDIDLPGPMTVSWELPKHARRVGGWLVLDDSHWAWGDCHVTVSLAPGGSGSAAPIEVLSTRLNALNPAAMLAVDVSPGQRLVVHVSPGENGPVDDHVTLRHVLVLTAPPAD